MGQSNTDIADKGGRGVSHKLTITDKERGGVQTAPNIADIICELSLGHSFLFFLPFNAVVFSQLEAHYQEFQWSPV